MKKMDNGGRYYILITFSSLLIECIIGYENSTPSSLCLPDYNQLLFLSVSQMYMNKYTHEQIYIYIHTHKKKKQQQ